MSAEAIRELHRDQLKAFANRIDTVDPEDEDTFTAVLVYAYKYTDLTLDEIAKGVRYSRTQVNRWVLGSNHPHISNRKTIVAWIQKRCREIAYKDS